MLFYLLACGSLCLALEGFAHGGLWIIGRTTGLVYRDASISIDSLSARHRALLSKLVAGQTTYFDHSPTLGWTIKPGGSAGQYRSNRNGLRGDRDYQLDPPRGVRRIAAFGDSFTHADGVDNSASWAAILAARSRYLEVLNFGVSGYGLDQALLRYQEEAVAFKPDIVFIGFMPENIKRTVNVFRPFYGEATGLPLAKPRFLVENDGLVLVPNPLSSLLDYQSLLDDPAFEIPLLAEHDYFFSIKGARSRWDASALVRLAKTSRFAFNSRFADNHIIGIDGLYNERSEAFAVTKGLMFEFWHSVREPGAIPVVLLFPSRSDLMDHRQGRGVRYQPLVEYLAAQRMTVIDLREAFEADASSYDLDELFNGHYSPLGNRVVADYLFQWLDRQHLLPSSVVTADEKGNGQRC